MFCVKWIAVRISGGCFLSVSFYIIFTSNLIDILRNIDYNKDVERERNKLRRLNTMAHLENTYWNSNGAEQAKYDEMMAADWDDMMTQAAKADMHRYYRYYNDGDMPGWARGRWDLKVWSGLYGQWVLNEKGEQELEDRATAIILKEYKRFKKAQERGKI